MTRNGIAYRVTDKSAAMIVAQRRAVEMNLELEPAAQARVCSYSPLLANIMQVLPLGYKVPEVNSQAA
jgi:hypothetical protein